MGIKMTSIIDWIADNTDAKVYDYTKNPNRKSTDEYHLTFSKSETNEEDCKKWLSNGGNVAVVFNLGEIKGKKVHNISSSDYPSRYLGKPVYSGDLHDLRFLDPVGVIGLYAKGDALSDTSGFVVHNGSIGLSDKDREKLGPPLKKKKARDEADKIVDVWQMPDKAEIISNLKEGLNCPPQLLTKPGSNPKTSKSKKLDYLTYIMHLSPSTESGKNLCPHASLGCIASCLHTAGIPFILERKLWARICRSWMYIHKRDWFIEKLQKEILAAQKSCNKKGMKLALRLNGTSDIPWENVKV